jgi:hypothetical protein
MSIFSEIQEVFTDLMGIPFHVAYDDDIKNLVKKKGRLVLPGDSFKNIEFEISDANWKLKSLERDLEEIKANYESLTHSFAEVKR